MSRRIGIIVAIVAVVAVVAAFGVLSLNIVPMQLQNVVPKSDIPSMTSDNEGSSGENLLPIQNATLYNAFLETGYPDEMARLFSSVNTKVISSNSTYYHYFQTFELASVTRDLTISLTHGEKYVPVGDDVITSARGFDIYLKDVNFYSLPDGYATEMSYFIPYESLDPELVSQLGVSDSTQVISHIQIPGFQYASAAGEMNGVGVRSMEVSGTFVRSGQAQAPVDTTFMVERNTPSIPQSFDAGKTIDPVRSPESAQVQEFVRKTLKEQGRDWESQIEVHVKKVQLEKAAKLYNRAGNVLVVAGSAYDLYDIKKDYDRWDGYLEDLRGCAENPTNPLAQKAMSEDPNYARSTTDVISSAKTDLQVNTGARVASTGLNAAAGLYLQGQGGLALGLTSAAENAILEHTLEAYTMNDVAKGIVPCDEPANMGTPLMLSPMQVDFEYKYYRVQEEQPEECEGVKIKECIKKELTIDISGTAIIRSSYEPSTELDEGACNDPESELCDLFSRGVLSMGAAGNVLRGEGTGQIREIEIYTTTYSGEYPSGCGNTDETKWLIEGPLTLKAAAGVPGWVGVSAWGDSLPRDYMKTGPCVLIEEHVDPTTKVLISTYGRGESVSEHDENGSESRNCDFNGVDFVNGGTYSKFKEGEEGYGTCKIVLTPVRE